MVRHLAGPCWNSRPCSTSLPVLRRSSGYMMSCISSELASAQTLRAQSPLCGATGLKRSYSISHEVMCMDSEQRAQCPRAEFLFGRRTRGHATAVHAHLRPHAAQRFVAQTPCSYACLKSKRLFHGISPGLSGGRASGISNGRLNPQ